MDFYSEREIELLLNMRVAAIDPLQKTVLFGDSGRRKFDTLLLATGAEPVRLKIPGADSPQVCYLRSLNDCHTIIAKAAGAKRVVLVGASFIALEVAASLIQRELQVHVVAPEAVPMERVLGPQVGEYLRRLHERHGVVFHLQQSVAAIDERVVTLKDGQPIEADLVVVGIGVRPLTDLAERADIKTSNGVCVNEYLETSIPRIFAAGDIARWPDRLTEDNIRVEHWVVAERQGQTAARNILGQHQQFDAVPFFWTSQYDFTLNYVGHAEKWDKLDMEGSLEEHDCRLSFKRGGKTLAVATVGCDRESLEQEVAMEKAVQTRLAPWLRTENPLAALTRDGPQHWVVNRVNQVARSNFTFPGVLRISAKFSRNKETHNAHHYANRCCSTRRDYARACRPASRIPTCSRQRHRLLGHFPRFWTGAPREPGVAPARPDGPNCHPLFQFERRPERTRRRSKRSGNGREISVA